MNRSTWMLAAAAVPAIVFAAASHAQVQDEAKRVLIESTEALKAYQSVTFNAKRSATGPLAGFFDLEAKISLLRSAPGKEPMYLVVGRQKMQGQQDRQIHAMSDGKIIQWLDYKENKLFERPVKDTAKPTQEISRILTQLIPAEFISANPYDRELKSAKLAITGQDQVHGEVCDIVTAATATDDRQFIWAISVADRLPRRVELATKGGGAGQQLSFVTDMLSFNPAAGLKAEGFKIDLPTGFVKDIPPAPTAPVGQQGDIPAVEMGLPAGTDAPPFDLMDTEGKAHSLSSMRGNVVVLEFWGSMFPASTANFAEMQELSTQFKDQGVKVISLANREPDDAAAPALFKVSGASYPLIPRGDAVLNDYKVLGFPSYAVIAGNGKITSFFQGYPGRVQLADAITAAVNAGK